MSAHPPLLDAIDIALVLTSAEGCVQHCNRAARSLLGCGREGAPLWDAVVAPEEREALRSAFLSRSSGRVRTSIASGTDLLTIDWTFGDAGDGAVLATGHDVSHEQRLYRSEQHFRSIFDSSPDAVLILDPRDGTVLEANARACELYRLTLSELLAGSLAAFSTDTQDGSSRMRELFAHGSVSFETTKLRCDGTKLVVDVRATLVDHSGYKSILTVNREITEQKRNEEQDRAIADFGLTALTEHDLDALLREACHLVRGATGSDLVVVLRYIPEEDRFVIASSAAGLAGTDGMAFHDGPGSLTRFAFDADEPVVFGDTTGEPRFDASFERGLGYVSGICAPIDRLLGRYGTINVLSKRPEQYSPRDALFVKTITNTIGAATARRFAEDETHRVRRDYQRLIEIAQEGVIISDASHRVIFANRRMAEILGRSIEDIVGTGSSDFVAEEDRCIVEQQSHNRAGGLAGTYDIRLRRPDGAHVWVSIAASPSVDEQGTMVSAIAVVSDISARVRAEEDLRSRETQLREAQAIAHLGSFEYAAGTGAARWSDELFRIVGDEPQSRPVTTASILERIPAEQRTVVDRALAELLAVGTPMDERHELLRSDGVLRYVRTRVRRVAEAASGEPVVVGTVEDMTEERDEQRERLEREARLRLIVSNLPIFLWSTDADLHVTSLAGAGMTEVGGLELELADLFDNPSVEGTIRVVLEGKPATVETVALGRDLRLHVEPRRDVQGQIVGTVGIGFDITEQKVIERANTELLEFVEHAASEWSETFDSISSPIVLLDESLCVTRLNAAALFLTGAPDFPSVIGRPVQSLGESALWHDIAAIATSVGARREAVAVRLIGEDGRAWDIVGSPWSSTSRTTVVASDVTAIARMQETLQRSERMSEVGALVAGVVHEVRNPLFGISATLDAFEARFGDPQFHRYTSALREQLGRMNELTHDLLEFGRPVTSILVPTALAPVLVNARSSLRALARKAKVEVRVDTSTTLPEVISDRQRILQVFENLLKNAIQHSPEGGVVEMHARQEKGKREVVVTVEDRGPGFRDSDLPRIFEPFFTRRRGGTGLGLSLVQRIVDEHQGSITARNRDGGGATISVTLPTAIDWPSQSDRIVL